MGLPLELYIVLGILIVLIVLPALKIWRQRIPTVKEWNRINQNISDWDAGTLDSLKLTKASDAVLRQVLTEKPGIGQFSAIPLALESFAAIFEFRNRSLKSLASLSVLIGLMGAALVLAESFHGTTKLADIDITLISNITRIYYLTLISISVAVAISFWNFLSRQAGEKVFLLASEALQRLRTNPTEGVDPRLVSALQLVGEQFREWGELVQDKHSQKIELLMDEVKGLAGAIRNVVAETMKTSVEEGAQTMIVLRHLAERTELLSLRLDEGFRLLAQPFVQGVPAIDQLTLSTTSLQTVSEKILDRDIAGTMEKVETALRSMDSTLRVLPTTIIGGLKEGVGALRQTMVETVKSEIDPLLKISMEQREILNNLALRLETSFARGLDVMKTGTESRKMAIEGLEQSFESKFDQMQTMAGGFSDKIHQAIHNIADQMHAAFRAGLEKSEERSQVFKESLSAHIQNLGKEICDSINHANDQSLQLQRRLLEGLNAILDQNGAVATPVQTVETAAIPGAIIASEAKRAPFDPISLRGNELLKPIMTQSEDPPGIAVETAVGTSTEPFLESNESSAPEDSKSALEQDGNNKWEAFFGISRK